MGVKISRPTIGGRRGGTRYWSKGNSVGKGQHEIASMIGDGAAGEGRNDTVGPEKRKKGSQPTRRHKYKPWSED